MGEVRCETNTLATPLGEVLRSGLPPCAHTAMGSSLGRDCVFFQSLQTSPGHLSDLRVDVSVHFNDV